MGLTDPSPAPQDPTLPGIGSAPTAHGWHCRDRLFPAWVQRVLYKIWLLDKAQEGRWGKKRKPTLF